MIYLDNNATTRPLPEVIAAVGDALFNHWPNPSSVHRPGQEARRQVELARVALADLIGAKPRDLVLTSSGTESIDLAIRGRLATTARRAVVTTGVEHAAVRDLLEHLTKRAGVEVRLAPLDTDGVVRLDALEPLLTPDTALVSIQWANNETGAIQPVEAIGKLCREKGIVFHCDATQWVGKMPVASLDAFDLLTLSAHKFHGPKGIGVLWARPGVALQPHFHGSQEKGRRAGTENVPGIVGAGVAARLAKAWLDEQPLERERLADLRDLFEVAILAAIPEARINGPRERTQRLWNTTNIAFPRLEAEALLLAMSERGLAASAGAACSSGSLDPSPVLLAMGIPPELAHGSIRFSLSRETTAREIDEASMIVAACVARLRTSMTA